jgi:regulator of RNase E activity RraA
LILQLFFGGVLTVQIFARGKSTVGTNAESTVYARNIPVSITGVCVSPVRPACQYTTFTHPLLTPFQGDILFLDPTEGCVVVIPQGLLDQTLALIPRLVADDDKVKEAVQRGMTVAEAFRTFRS